MLLLCRPTTLQSFAPKLPAPQTAPLRFAVATTRTLRHTHTHAPPPPPTPGLYPCRMGSSSQPASQPPALPAACTRRPRVTARRRVGRGSGGSPCLRGEPAAPQRAQRPPAALRYTAAGKLRCRPAPGGPVAAPRRARERCPDLAGRGGLAFPTSSSGRAAPLQRVPLDAPQRQAGATRGNYRGVAAPLEKRPRDRRHKGSAVAAAHLLSHMWPFD